MTRSWLEGRKEDRLKIKIEREKDTEKERRD